MPFVLPSEDELRARLSAEEYDVLRNKGTEIPYTGDYLLPDKVGVYTCKLCGHDVFASTAQFNSMMGWPAFDAVLPNGVEEQTDTTPGMERAEVVCADCKSHLGYHYQNGHTVNKQHYCINGAALVLDTTKIPPPKAPVTPLSTEETTANEGA
jgi:peptide-methionine (R)-S-oxide reductase